MIQKFFRVLLILGMIAAMCGAVSAEGMGIVAETHETSGMDAPVCTAPCQCMAETAAIAQWGVNGYEMCSKTICGQSADAMVQYHCINGSTGSDKRNGAGTRPECGGAGSSSRSRDHAEIAGRDCDRHCRDRRCTADCSGNEKEIILRFF